VEHPTTRVADFVELLRLGFCSRFGLGFIAFQVLAVKAFDTAGGVEYLLLARKERVAGGADFNVDVALVSAAGQELMSASAHHFDFIVGRVSLSLHFPSIRQVPARASIGAKPL
jgi:hypothetical protein